MKETNPGYVRIRVDVPRRTYDRILAIADEYNLTYDAVVSAIVNSAYEALREKEEKRVKDEE